MGLTFIVRPKIGLLYGKINIINKNYDVKSY